MENKYEKAKVLVNVPSFLKAGAKFKGVHINGGNNTCTLLSIDKDKNKAVVDIEVPNTSWVEDDWNLQHLIWGFENKNYILNQPEGR